MTCSAAEPFLLDDLADLAPEVQSHVAGCTDCQRLRDDLRETQTVLRAHLTTPPPEALRSAFAAHLEEVKRSRWTESSLAPDRAPARPALRFVRRGAVLGAVFALGALSVVLTRPQGAARSYAVFEQLDSPSSAERLAGILTVRDEVEEVPEQAIVDALLVTLHSDPSVNVRVAALDALTPYGGRERVRVGVLRALAADSEPLVQMAALRFVEAHQPSGAPRALDVLLAQPDLEPLVRSQAETLTVSI